MKKVLLFCLTALLFAACDNQYYHENVCLFTIVNQCDFEETFKMFINDNPIAIEKKYEAYKYSKEEPKEVIDEALCIQYNVPKKLVGTTAKVTILDGEDEIIYNNEEYFINGGFNISFKIDKVKNVKLNEFNKIYGDNWDTIEL